MKQVINLVFEGLMFWLLLTTGFGVGLCADIESGTMENNYLPIVNTSHHNSATGGVYDFFVHFHTSSHIVNKSSMNNSYISYMCMNSLNWMYEKCMNSYEYIFIKKVNFDKPQSVACMNMYEVYETPNQSSMKMYENVHTPKDYIVGLNTSIDRSERVEGWTCYDYSIDFAKNNPNFEVVTVSRSPEFEGISHMTNYQFYDDETMIVYDGLLDKLYFIHNLQWDVEDYDYYYFWINETPTRECVDMVDNRMWLYE